MTRPMARMPSSRTPSSSIVAVTRRLDLVVAELLGQVVRDHRGLGPFLLGLLDPAGVGEGFGRLAALLGLAGQHAEHVLVGQLACLLAGDLRVGDRGQHHPQGGGADLVTRLDRGGQVRAQLLLQTHACPRSAPGTHGAQESLCLMTRSLRSLMSIIVAALRAWNRPPSSAACAPSAGASGSALPRASARWRTPPGSRCATSSYAAWRWRCCRPGTGRSRCCTSATCT